MQADFDQARLGFLLTVFDAEYGQIAAWVKPIGEQVRAQTAIPITIEEINGMCLTCRAARRNWKSPGQTLRKRGGVVLDQPQPIGNRQCDRTCFSDLMVRRLRAGFAQAVLRRKGRAASNHIAGCHYVDIALREAQTRHVMHKMSLLQSALPDLTIIALLCFAQPALPTEGNQPPTRKHSNIERLALPRLKATHENVLKLRAQRTKIPPLPDLHDYRCILHAHAEDSDHTGGSLPEMLADAKKAGISAILLTDHFRPPRDFIDGRWRGLKEGVLFIPGSEIRGCLLYPEKSVLDKMEKPFAELLEAVTAGDGMCFLSHVEERKDFSMTGLTGLEIYNRHWDAKKDMASLIAVAMKLTDPKQLAELEEAVRLYPDELLAFQCDYPQVYMDKWDAGTKLLRLTGVAANDCHHNQVFIVKMVDEETVLLGTIVDKDEGMRKIKAESRPGIKELTKGHKPGDVLVRVDLDPYERSFWNSSTHVLAPKLDEPTLRAALKAGHAYVAHDWMCEATGFRVEALNADGKPAGIMGDELQHADGLKLRAQLPLACQMRLLRNGVQVAETVGKDRMEFPVKEPGVYRLEAWLTVDDEPRPWIFANPIYVR